MIVYNLFIYNVKVVNLINMLLDVDFNYKSYPWFIII